MTRYAGRRVLAMVPVLLIVSVLVFLMIHLVPGDPVQIMLSGSGASAQEIRTVRHELGLDRPLPEQYVLFVEQMVDGRARSILTGQPVITSFFNVFPYTLELTLTSMAVAVVIGVGLGTVAAIRPRSWVDYLSMVTSFVGISIPNFWLAMVLVYFFAVGLHWLPATGGGGGDVRHLVLPAAVLAVQQVALIARFVRASMVEALQEDYVRTARAKGLHERTVTYVHALRNALLPTVTLLGLNFGYLLGGAVILEIVFARPGIGRLIVDAILSKDFPVVQGAVLFTAVTYLLVNLLTDLSYAAIDPRIRY